MFKEILESLNLSGAAMSVISIALMLIGGFLLTRITKILKLPNVTAYILTGIILGPYVLGLIPETFIEKSEIINDVAIAFISFAAGEYFSLNKIKKNGPKVIIIALFETLITSIIVFLIMRFVLKLNSIISVIFAAVASATASTSTLMTIRQTKAKGDFVDTLLGITAIDNIIALIFFSICISLTVSSASESGSILEIFKSVGFNILGLIIGGLFGWLLKALLPTRRTKDNRLIIAVATLFVFSGICILLGISPLLGCMAMGATYKNLSQEDEKLFKQINYFAPPFLCLFFVRSGANLNFASFFSSSSIGNLPLILIAIIYFVIRIIGKYGGAFLGCLTIKKNKEVRNYLGFALIPQASVAIGLGAIASRAIGGETGVLLETIIVVSSVLSEIIGPALAKLSLSLSHSYSDDIDEITNVEIIDENGNKKNDVEVLIEQINEIKKQNPHNENEVNLEEEAFEEAADEYFEVEHYRNHRFRNRR